MLRVCYLWEKCLKEAIKSILFMKNK
ncbi:CLUMA_CG004655, isoform A [Clunio marinus]|uniref:CLUMA_CG004655, isoform A n=1 Tax=Clunio marinus TaxID=568069 RepID=A0A1J1HWR0_9DIPT|nr:CLUMA_CG004655, isoform A [Clunio marinus]